MPVATENGVSNKNQGQTTMYQITATKSDAELNDQDILNLVNYFEVSRVDLKNV